MVQTNEIFRAQVARALRALALHSPKQFSWFGCPFVTDVAEKTFVSQLQTLLYTCFYCPGGAKPDNRIYRTGTALDRRRFTHELSTANKGSGYRQSGWELVELRGDNVTVRGDRMLVSVPLSAHIAGFAGCHLGETVELWQPNESLAFSNGFYTAYSDWDLPWNGTEPVDLVRLYFNLAPASATLFLKEASTLLNAEKIPYRIKILSDPMSFGRCDSVVLYIPSSFGRGVMKYVAQIHAVIAEYLRFGVPAFTREITRGVGLAEDPPGHESFGMSRCRLLANAIAESYTRVELSLAEQLKQVAKTFTLNGLDLNLPYLNSANSEVEFWEMPHLNPTVNRLTFSTSDYALLALSLGKHLVDTAIWSGHQCVWLAGSLSENISFPVRDYTRYGLMGGDRISGTAGVALFLAILASTSGDRAIARTATGAIRHAISSTYTISGCPRLGLFNGVLGIASAAGQVGRLIDCADALDFSEQIYAELDDDRAPPLSLNLCEGLAGVVVGCLLLEDLLNQVKTGQCHRVFGAELQARVTSILSDPVSELTLDHQSVLRVGYATGAAGIAQALMEMFHSTRDTNYLRLASQVFAKEFCNFEAVVKLQKLFYEVDGNLRNNYTGLETFEDLCSWERGIAGLAISRLRAYSISLDDEFRAQAEYFIKKVHECLRIGLESRISNHVFSPGMIYCAEIALYAHEKLLEVHDGKNIAYDLGDAILEAFQDPYERRKHLRDIGPALDRGAAGLGCFLLQLTGAIGSSAHIFVPMYRSH
ncbi:MAG: T3SS effector HopA1 family protein [Halobacteriota archaeon]